MGGKKVQFMVFTFLENALNLCIFTPTPVPHSKNGFPQDERVEENYDLLYQNSIRKYEDDLEY